MYNTLFPPACTGNVRKMDQTAKRKNKNQLFKHRENKTHQNENALCLFHLSETCKIVTDTEKDKKEGAQAEITPTQNGSFVRWRMRRVGAHQEQEPRRDPLVLLGDKTGDRTGPVLWHYGPFSQWAPSPQGPMLFFFPS